MSIDLMKTAHSDDKFEEAGEDEEGAGTDEDGDDEFDRKERELFENAGRKERSLISTWKEAGKKKDKVLNTLISKFAMLVHKNDTEEIEAYLQTHYDGATLADYCTEDIPHDALYSKLPSAVKALIKLIAALEDNDSSETRDFTIFIAKKRWVKAAIRPMLELAAIDQDMISVQYCRKLLFWLLKDMSESTYKALEFNPFKPDRDFRQKEEDEAEPVTATDAVENGKKPVRRHKVDSQLMAMAKLRKQNAVEQYQALISFKEALCGEQAIRAIVLLFGKMWQAELTIKEEYASSGNMNNIPNNKLVDASRQSYISVGVCLICVSRLLEINAMPALSNADQIKSINRSHQQLIVYTRAVLIALPGIFAELYADVKSVRYFDSWLSYLFRILKNALRGFRASELFLVWQEGGLLNVQQQESIIDAHATVPVPAGIQMRNSGASASASTDKHGGTLKSQLKQEKSVRAISLGFRGGRTTIDSRHSRFGGIFVTPVAESTPQAKDDAVDDHAASLRRANNALSSRATAFVKRGVQIACNAQALPTGKAKQSKKSVAFATSSDQNLGKAGDALERCGQEACVVVATVADMLCESKGLNELIKRVNEDLRRDEGVFYDDMELVYFDVLSKMLAYNRFKLMAEKAEFERRVAANEPATNKNNVAEAATGNVTVNGWVPDLRNMIEATSNMSENRVVRSMEDLMKKKNVKALHKPIECFKEIICYIRIELQSANLGHRDLAVAALFRIFYTMTTDRRDPLPKLIADWKPSAYTKDHTHCLVELVHETMKTLDLAHSIFSDEAEIAKARKLRMKRGASMDIEQYTAAAYRFDVDEYFRKLVSNGSVHLYTRLLEKYASNDANTNHYVYCFFQRLNNFQIEQTFPTPSPQEVKIREAGEEVVQPTAPVTLGYMLFNIYTMSIFSTLLNDPAAQTSKPLIPLVRLAKAVVRRFGEVSQKNHMLFVECLFQHPNPAKHMCERVDNVYDAQAYKPGTDSFHHREDKDRKKREGAREDDVNMGEDSASDDENNRARAADAGFIMSGSEDEFDENDPNFAAQPKNIKAVMAAKKRKELEKIRRKEERRAQKHDDDSSSREKSGGRLKKKDRSRKWSPEEDAILRRLYMQYAGSSSMFQIISTDEDLLAIGKDRSTTAVQKRCKELDLHMTTGRMSADAEDSDDELLFDAATLAAASPLGAEPSSQAEAEAPTQSQPAQGSRLVDSLDLDSYEASAVAHSPSKKRKMVQKKAASGLDSDDEDLELFDTAEDSGRAQKSARGHNRGIIDSDDE